jgi:nucleotidyltransferase/DNA polymerase involved in DNA repair
MPVALIDMDYFFAACEELRHPEFIGKPLVVGTANPKDKSKGVVQTCNYEARSYGIHSGMALSDAMKLCQSYNYVEADDSYYDKVSSQIMELIRSYGYPMEQMSIDEAAIDLGDMGYDKARKICSEIKVAINERIGLKCTIGISSTKIYAKMACDAAKPNGLLVVEDHSIVDFISSKPITKLPGIGPKTAAKLNAIGIKNIGDIAKTNPSKLVGDFGSFGREIYLLAIGKDESKVVTRSEVLSIGREHTLANKTSSMQELENQLKLIANEVWKEVEKQGYFFKGVSIKIRGIDFSEHIKNIKLSNYAGSEEAIERNAILLLHKAIKPGIKVRKIGVRVYDLMPKKGQKTLF